METDRLEEFVVLADCLNYRKAASLLYLTQPVLSRHISDLEQELGVKLFVRDTHKVTLTPIGEMVARESGNILDAYHKAMRNIKLAKENMDGRLAVGILGQAVRSIITQFIAYLGATSKLQVDYTSSPTMESLIRLLESDTLDLAFVAHVDREQIKGLAVQWIRDDPMYLGVSQDHPLAGRESVSIRDLSGVPMIGFDREADPHTALFHEKLFERHGAEMNVVRSVSNLESGLFYASLGIGFFILPKHRSVLARDLVLIPISDADAHVSLSLIWKKDHSKSAVKTFIQEFTAFYQKSLEE